ncbi:MAG: hypothetical protein ACRC2K_08855 [Clostridium sp.]
MREKGFLKNIDLLKAKKGGFTVVEVLAYIAISTIVIGLMMTLSFSLFRSIKVIVNEHRNLNKVESSLINLGGIITGKENKSIGIDGNKIMIYIEEKDRYGNVEEKKKEIFLENAQIKVNNYKKEFGSFNKINYNLLLDKVDGFKVWSNKRIIYVSIEREGVTFVKGF